MFSRSLIILLTFLITPSFGQTSRLSLPEKWWVLWHPVAALKVKRITRQCFIIYNAVPFQQRLDKYESGGRMDAFRHVFFMAAYAQKVRTRKIRKLGIRHEQGNYKTFTRSKYEEGEPPDSLASVMDLRNNEAGLVIGFLNRDKDLSALSDIVIEEIRKGNCWVMKRDKKGKYTECDGKTIDMTLYKGRWYVPKCLLKPEPLK